MVSDIKRLLRAVGTDTHCLVSDGTLVLDYRHKPPRVVVDARSCEMAEAIVALMSLVDAVEELEDNGFGIADAAEEIERLRNDLEDKENECDDLEGAIGEHEDTISNLEDENNDLRTENEKLREEIEDLFAEVRTLRAASSVTSSDSQ